MDVNMLNGNTLAFIGDAVFSLQVRNHFVDLGITNCNKLQKKTIEYVSAKGQCKILENLQTSNVLTEEELDIVRRGRNAKSSTSAKNADIITYRKATGFEALWGYLYLNEEYERLKYLFNKIIEEENNG